jgi:hypothetical protein
MNPKTVATRVVATGLIAPGRARPARNSGIRLLAAAGVLAATGGAFAQAPSRVVLQIHEVVCVDETNSGSIIGEHGNDNMILGGVTIAPNGRKTQIKTVKVGTFQEDGKHKTFSSPMQFASIPVSTGNLREYGMLLVLAEEDISGGTNEFVAKLLKGDSSGSSTDDSKADGGATAVAGEVAKEIAKELAKRAVERLKENAKDDIFRPQDVTVVLRESDLRFPNGKTSTAPQTATFSGHGGKYAVTYSWKLVS